VVDILISIINNSTTPTRVNRTTSRFSGQAHLKKESGEIIVVLILFVLQTGIEQFYLPAGACLTDY
jgi:hypothetical protein